MEAPVAVLSCHVSLNVCLLLLETEDLCGICMKGFWAHACSHHRTPSMTRRTATCFALHCACRSYVKGYWAKGGASSSAAAAGSGAAAGGDGSSAAAGVGASEPLMLKVKDWPPGQDFRGELPRHMMVRATVTVGSM
jgi:hypothetical protein